jgi:hypothetical protein
MNEQQIYQQQRDKLRPTNTVDLQVMTTEPFISSEFMSDRIRNRFRNFDYVRDEEGNIVYQEVKDDKGIIHVEPKIVLTKDYWVGIELFTQDLRLGNVDASELKYIRYNLDLCSDILTCLPETFNKPVFLLLERSVSVIETSQSSKGFLRNLFNTFFSNQKITEEQPKKSSFFNFGKSKSSGDN